MKINTIIVIKKSLLISENKINVDNLDKENNMQNAKNKIEYSVASDENKSNTTLEIIAGLINYQTKF